MTTEALGTQEAPLAEQWQRAIALAPAVLKGRDPKITDEKLAEQVGAVEAALEDFAHSDALKLVTWTGEDGAERRSVETADAETPGFGLEADLYAGVMGLSEPHYFKHGDPTSDELLGTLADVSQKPVSALVQGQYLPPVAPQLVA